MTHLPAAFAAASLCLITQPLAARSLSPAPDPVVYLHGGPASGTLNLIGPVGDRLFPNHRLTRDIVTFDQRAAALSATSVECYNNIAERIVGLIELDAGTGGEDVINELFEPCLEEIRASGADMSAYNTENNARDVQALTQALDYPDYNLYGISYGTRLALEVLRTAPEGVRSAVIDGVGPSTVRIYDDLFLPFVEVLDKLVEQCAADAACDDAYPGLKSTIEAAFARLEEEPFPAVRGQPAIDKMTLFDLTFDNRNSWRDQRTITPYLPRIFAEVAAGDTTTINAVLARATEPDQTNALRQVSGLTADERALALAAIDMAIAMENLGGAASETLVQLRADVSASAETVTVAEAFELRSNEALLAMTDRDAVARLIREYAVLRGGEPSREALEDWVTASFPSADQPELLVLVAAMNEADIARTWEIAGDQTRPYELAIAGLFGLDFYACQEDVPWNSVEGFNAGIGRAIGAYSLFDDPDFAAWGDSLFEQCASFTQYPRPDFQTPVTSEVPVLALNGTLDVQTSMHWGAAAAETLPNARNYIIPEAGHGSIAFQPCANDISVAFLNDPEAELDTSCIASLTPRFVLPDDPLP